MNTHRFIFLDIDGVLNHDEWYHEIHAKYSTKELISWGHNKYHMSPKSVQLLNQLSGSEVIISSSWGYDDDTVQGLRDAGLKLPIIGGTSRSIELNHHWVCRGNSIAHWFDQKYGCVPWDLFFEDGWYNTHRTYNGTLGELSEGKEEVVVHEDNEKITYVIFDDSNDMLMWQADHFIHVNSSVGLTQSDIDKAKQILNINY